MTDMTILGASSDGISVRAPEGLDVAGLTRTLLGSEPTLTRGDVVARTGIPLQEARRLWQALGFSAEESEVVRFTDADCAALGDIVQIAVSGGLSENAAIALVRSVASTVNRLAAWQVELLVEELAGLSGEPLVDPPGSPTGPPTRVGPWSERAKGVDPPTLAQLVVSNNDRLERFLVYAWRRHLLDTLVRHLDSDDPADVLHPQMVVGSADLVGFTALVSGMNDLEAAHLIERFEALTSSLVVHHHGRVVKTVGDEVLFTCVDPVAAAQIALDVVAGVTADHRMPPVRVAMARGAVISRHGDVFGHTVNLVSRLRAIARPDSVVIGPEMARALGDVPWLSVRPFRRQRLRGIGSVTPHRVKYATAPTS